MVNEIVDGISRALREEFGEDVFIYTDDTTQGIEPPCFSIVSVEHASTQKRPGRYLLENSFCIHYFPSTIEPHAECRGVAERMNRCLEIITHGDDLIRGRDQHDDIDDNVLHYFVTYDFYTQDIETKEPMTHLTQYLKGERDGD